MHKCFASAVFGVKTVPPGVLYIFLRGFIKSGASVINVLYRIATGFIRQHTVGHIKKDEWVYVKQRKNYCYAFLNNLFKYALKKTNTFWVTISWICTCEKYLNTQFFLENPQSIVNFYWARRCDSKPKKKY